MKSAYEQLKHRYKSAALLGVKAERLEYDSATLGVDHTAKIERAAAQQYDLLSGVKVEELLDKAMNKKDALAPLDQRNLELMHKGIMADIALGKELVVEMKGAAVKGDMAHTKYRDKGDWEAIAPFYEKTFDLARKSGEILASKFGHDSAYQMWVDEYTPDLKIADIEREFKKLDEALPPIINAALDRQAASPPAIPLLTGVSEDDQMRMNLLMARVIGFDDTAGHFRLGTHPACYGNGFGASNIITAFDEDTPMGGVYSTIHESGHAYYERNLPREYAYTEIGKYNGMAVHESQSRIMENNVARSPEFVEFISAKAQEIFGSHASLSPENLLRHAHHVERAFIRTEADELTYPMHISLRFELEKALMEGSLKVKDLPKAWNEGMEKRLGITPPNPAKGCMQDVHWPCGLVGYFPSYTIGTMMASQFMSAAEKANPDMRKGFAKGDITPLQNWLIENVHSKGSTISADAVMKAASGEGLNSDHYINHLKTRYTPEI